MMAAIIMTGSFAVALTVFTAFSEKAKQRGRLPLWLAYLIFLFAVMAWLNFFAAVIEFSSRIA